MAINPLGPQHLDLIREGLAKLADVQDQITMAERAGLKDEVAASKHNVEEAIRKLTQIKDVYFPGQ